MDQKPLDTSLIFLPDDDWYDIIISNIINTASFDNYHAR